MKAHKKAQRAEKKALELLAKLGADTSSLKNSSSSYAPRESISQKSLEAEATIAYWESGKVFREKECSHCGRRFATNYASVANCSDKCRAEELAKIGIEWSPFKTQHERWGRTPPLVVPQEALDLIKEIRAEGQSQSHAQSESDVDAVPESEHQSTDDIHTLPHFSLD